jgi:NDP-sugar pyrophosphorylase family protein
LRSSGISDVIINVHHLADSIVEYLKINNSFGMKLEISREDILLDTGGGLKKAAHFFLEDELDEPFLLHNVDVISSIDIGRMIQFHLENYALATLAVQERETSRYLLFDRQLQLCGRRSSDQGDELVRSTQPLQALAFCGIHVLSRQIFPLLTEEGVFPIIPAYLRLAGQGERILGFRADEYSWRDLGTPESVRQAAEHSAEGILPR